MYSLNCKVCGLPLRAVDQMNGKCQGTEEQKASSTCGLNNPWFDYWNTYIYNTFIKGKND